MRWQVKELVLAAYIVLFRNYWGGHLQKWGAKHKATSQCLQTGFFTSLTDTEPPHTGNRRQVPGGGSRPRVSKYPVVGVFEAKQDLIGASGRCWQPPWSPWSWDSPCTRWAFCGAPWCVDCGSWCRWMRFQVQAVICSTVSSVVWTSWILQGLGFDKLWRTKSDSATILVGWIPQRVPWLRFCN